MRRCAYVVRMGYTNVHHYGVAWLVSLCDAWHAYFIEQVLLPLLLIIITTPGLEPRL